jgi:hypothetical protein
VGGWGKAENKAKFSPAGAGSWAELGKRQLKMIFFSKSSKQEQIPGKKVPKGSNNRFLKPKS